MPLPSIATAIAIPLEDYAIPRALVWHFSFESALELQFSPKLCSESESECKAVPHLWHTIERNVDDYYTTPSMVANVVSVKTTF